MHPPAPTDAAPTVHPALSPANRDQPRRIDDDAPCGHCGYNLRGLALGAACPECNEPIARSLGVRDALTVSRVNRRWAMLVFVGIVGLLLECPGQIWVELQMRFGNEAFGSSPRLNLPAPKIWAVPLVQRSLGYRPEWLGVQGTWLALLGLASLFLVTSPRSRIGHEATCVLRLATRWIPAILLGGFFGFLMNAEYTYDSDIAVGKYAMFGVIGVELPCTALMLLYLARVARELNLGPLSSQIKWASLGAGTLQVVGIGMMILAKELTDYRAGLVVQVWSALYAAACVIVSLMITGAMARLLIELLTVIAPRRMSDALR